MREHHHHTDEQVEDYIDKALALVEARDIPDDLRAVVLGHAVTLFSAKQVFYTQEDAAPLNAGVGAFLNQRPH